MGKIRIYDLAKRHSKTNAEVKELLEKGGMEVSSASVSVDEAQLPRRFSLILRVVVPDESQFVAVAALSRNRLLRRKTNQQQLMKTQHQ